MGGATVSIKGNDLVKILEDFIEQKERAEKLFLHLDKATLMVKQKKGEWLNIGSNSIETAITKMYNKEPKEKFVLALHFGK